MANVCSNLAVLSVCNHASPVEGGTKWFTSGPQSFVVLQKGMDCNSAVCYNCQWISNMNAESEGGLES